MLAGVAVVRLGEQVGRSVDVWVTELKCSEAADVIGDVVEKVRVEGVYVERVIKPQDEDC